jgi:predicted GIY-YIG superfamily endonuclease
MFLPQMMLLSPMGENKNINEDRHTIISSPVGGAVLKEKVKSTTTKTTISSTALGVAADVKYDSTSMIKELINNSSSVSTQHLLLDDENYDDYDDDNDDDTIPEDSSETIDTISDVKRSFCVYLLVNDKNKCTYIGMTNNMARRLRQHNGEIVGGARYTTLKRGEGSWYYYGYVMNLSKSMALSIEKKIQKRTRRTKGSSPLDRRLNCIEQLLRDEYSHDGISFLRLF